MELSNRPVEWIAISAVVAGGLWAAFAFAPGGAPAAAPASRDVFDSHAAAATAAAAPLATAAGAEGDRLLVVPERRPAAAAPAAPVSGLAAAPAPAPRARFSPPRLKATRPIVSPDDATQTSAFMAAGSDDIVTAEPSAAAASRSLASRTGELAPASAVHYGVVDRTSLMSRGAGPVYNFKSRSSRGSRSSGQ